MSAPDGTNPRTSRKSFLWFKSLPMSDIGSHTCILAGNHIANARRARQPIWSRSARDGGAPQQPDRLMAWFSQSYFTQKGIWRRDRELLQNCPIIFPALPPVQRYGRRGGIGPGAIQYYWRRFELGVMELRARDRLDPFDSD